MDKDAIAFLDGETVEEPEVVEDVAEAELEQPEVEAEKVEAEPEQTGEEVGEPPAPEPEEPVSEPVQHAPLTALLDEREKRQEAQRKAEDYDRQLREVRAEMQRLQQPKQEAPDWFENPQEAAQFHNNQVEQQFQARMLQQSKFLAEREFGSETVTEAVSYFDQNPAASQQFKDHPSPFHAAVEFYQRQKVAQEIGSDPEAYKAQLREQVRAELQAEMTQTGASVQSSRPKAPPPSAARSPSVGGDTITAGTGFDAMFPD